MSKKRLPRVLVFEDTDQEYEALEPMIVANGYRASRAATPEEFRREAPWSKYDMIIMDLFFDDGQGKQVPIGIELIREVRTSNTKIPIIVASTWEPDRNQVAESFRAGARDYVDKEALISDSEGILKHHLQAAKEEYTRGAEDELPLPMAFLLRDLRRSKVSPRQRLERVVELFEVTLKLVTFSMISANRSRIDQVAPDLRAAFNRPSLGHLSKLIDALAVKEGLMKLIADATHTSRFREITGNLINVRNDFIGHGGLQRDAMYEKQLELHEPELEELLDLVDDFRRLQVISPVSARIQEEEISYDLKLFRGSNPEPESREVVTTNRLTNGRVYLATPDCSESLELDPWCQYAVCERCLNQKLFLYRLARHGELWMIDHVYGHSLETRNGWKTHDDLFGH